MSGNGVWKVRGWIATWPKSIGYTQEQCKHQIAVGSQEIYSTNINAR